MVRLPARPRGGGSAVRPVGERFTGGSAADRSAHFARREAASVLRRVLQGDATGRAAASIKSLVYSPSVRNKRATLALVCQTLKYLPILQEILAQTKILTSKWKKQEELVYVTSYDVLFGQEIALTGSVEKFIVLHKERLKSALAILCVKRKVKHVEDLLIREPSDRLKPRYLRVNTLKIDTDLVREELSKVYVVAKDELVPDLLVLPHGSDLHHHPFVLEGKVFLQGKASSMVSFALRPQPGWTVIDACAAPGNKTVHLAALMEGKGDLIACELHDQRIKTLRNTIKRSGATNIKTVHGDFLDLDANHPLYSKVRAILLDPSCSGSGISAERLDYLLPSYSKGSDVDTRARMRKLAAFQKKALAHALSFPAVERVVYSTCSVHQAENEDVIRSVMPLASTLGFTLETLYPQWHRRGLPVFEGYGLEGFFIALFVRHGAPERSRKVAVKHHWREAICSSNSLRLSRLMMCGAPVMKRKKR